MKSLIFALLAGLALPAWAEQSSDEMRRDIELEFQRLQARDERSSTQPPSKPAETRPATSYTATPQAVVVNSPWDASVHQVERYLKRVLKDPK
jgi:hypothetical protein